jgi:hypothetical protein
MYFVTNLPQVVLLEKTLNKNLKCILDMSNFLELSNALESTQQVLELSGYLPEGL